MQSEIHPTADELTCFLASADKDTKRNSNVVGHLLSNCRVCRDNLAAIGWGSERLDRFFHLPGSTSTPSAAARAFEYGRAFASADRALGDFLAADRPAETAPGDLLAQIALLPPEEQVRTVQGDARFAHPQFVRFLIEKCYAARYEDPETMFCLADLAQHAAAACTPESTGNAARLADLRAKAWSNFANALRVRGQIAEAEQAFATAGRYREQGTRDPLLHARILEQTASLCRFQHNFERAIELAEEAGGIYREIGATNRLANSMVHQAIAALYGGDPENAVRILNRALPLIDHEDDPHLLLAACHNLIRCYIDLDKPEQALALYARSRDLYKEFKDTLIQMRAAWQEGQLLRELGHLRAAETALLRARNGFLQQGLAYEVAVVSLDLSTVYIKLGEAAKLQETIAESMPIFRSLRVGRDVLATLLQLQQMADQEHQALAVIHQLSERLQKISNRNLLK